MGGRWEKSVFLIVLFAVLLLTAAMVPGAFSKDENAKKQDSKTLFEQKCLKCHKIAKFKDQNNSRKEWVLILTRMQRSTCPMTDDELEILADYLAKTYGD